MGGAIGSIFKPKLTRMNMDETLLLQAGLTEGEIKVYLALLDLGESKTGPIIKKSRISSSKVYDILNKLIEKGLVSSVTKENIKYFNSADPKRILDYVRAKEKILAEKRGELEKIIPQLALRKQVNENAPYATVFEGIKGIKTAYTQMLNELKKGEEIQVLGARGGTPLEMYQAFFREWHNLRVKKGIKAKMMFNLEARETYDRDREANALTEVKYLPEEASSPGTINMYEDYILISILTENPVLIKIQNKIMTNSFKEYFRILWNQETRTLRGKEGIAQLCEEVVKTKADLYLIGANGMLFDKYPKIADLFEKSRVAVKIRRHHLSIDRTRNHILNKLPNTEVRYLPREFDSPIVIWVFGDKVATVFWDEDIVSITQNKKIAEDYRKYFNLLRKIAKQ